MKTAVYIILGLVTVMTLCLVLGSIKLERRQQAWEWLHPPEDDDGVSILKNEDPDGDCTR